LCRRIKSDGQTGRLPVLVIAQVREQTLVNRFLRDGADDFVAEPHHTELLWRVRGLLRRYEAPAPRQEILSAGAVTVDPAQGVATLSGEELELTRKELLLLEVFVRHPGRVLSRRFLLEAVWGYDAPVLTRVVDLCVFQLRQKLGRFGRGLTTRRGFGYVLTLE
jgi:DNA-binding response OmpR family regulator